MIMKRSKKAVLKKEKSPPAEEPRIKKIESSLKILVRTLYDLQTLRINLGNRTSRAGKEIGTLAEHIRDRLTNYHDELHEVENHILKDIQSELKAYPIWTDYLKKVKGCGPTMAGVIISEIDDILRFGTVSKLWAYCGYAVKDGQAQRRKRGEKANWNSFFKSKLYIVAQGFLRANNPKYRKLYDDYKHRIQSRKCPLDAKRHGGKAKIDKYGCTDGHRHAMATRYMIKMFLMELYLTWWGFEGKEPRPPYQEEYLKHKHVTKKVIKKKRTKRVAVAV